PGTGKASSQAIPEDISASQPVLSELTVESVESTITNIETKVSARARLISLIKLDSVKQLICQLPKSFTGLAKKSTVLKLVIERYPILEPIVDVFVGTLDKSVEDKVNNSVDKLADALLQKPENAYSIISDEAQKIVDSVEVKI